MIEKYIEVCRQEGRLLEWGYISDYQERKTIVEESLQALEMFFDVYDPDYEPFSMKKGPDSIFKSLRGITEEDPTLLGKAEFDKLLEKYF